MFGKRGNEGFGKGGPAAQPPVSAAATAVMERPAAPVLAEPVREAAPVVRAQPSPPPMRKKAARTEDYYDTKSQVFSALIDTIDLSQLAKLDTESAREEIRDIVNDIITIKNFALSISEQE
jgi:pilus assembly protein CpaF